MRANQINFLIVFFSILLSGSLYYASSLKNVLLIPMVVSLVMYFLARLQYINKRKLIFLSFAALLTLSNLQSVTSSLMVLLACLVCALIITETICFDDFARAYIKIVLILSVASWLYLPIVFFQIPSHLPDFTSIVNTPYSNFILFGIFRAQMPPGYDDMYYVYRNSGLFWEPGAFQIFVNTALYLTIIINELTPKRILIFLVTILSIGSSTGIIVFGLLMLVHFMRVNAGRFTKKNIGILVIALLIVIVFTMSLMGEAFVNKFKVGSSSYVSFASRSMDNLIDISVLDDNLVTGVGYGNYSIREQYGIQMMGYDMYFSDSKPTGSDGLVLFVSNLGILGFLMIWRLLFPSQIKNWPMQQRSLIILAIVLMYNNENMMQYLLPWVMVYYGFETHAKRN